MYMCSEHLQCAWCQALVIERYGTTVLVEPGFQGKLHPRLAVHRKRGLRRGLTAETTLEGECSFSRMKGSPRAFQTELGQRLKVSNVEDLPILGYFWSQARR